MTESAFHGWPARAPSGRIAYVNGTYLRHGEATVHIEDRGLQFADSIYEVFGVVDGTLVDEQEHLERLDRSLGEIGMARPMAHLALLLVLREVARRNAVRYGLIYLQVSRGTLRRDHAIPKNAPRPTVIATARRIDRDLVDQRRKAGVRAVTRPDERWARCDIKSTALLPNILAKTSARDDGAFEAWLVDRDGYVTEGSSSTAWIVDGKGNLVTRDLSRAILPGVTRRVMIEKLAAAQLSVVERRFTPEEAYNAREAFITAATLGAMPVIAIDGRRVGDGRPGPIVNRVEELYRRKPAAKDG